MDGDPKLAVSRLDEANFVSFVLRVIRGSLCRVEACPRISIRATEYCL